MLQAITVELDELADHAQLARHLGNGQHQVGGGGALGRLPVSLKPTTCGISIDDGWPSMRLRFDAAHAPAQHADAVDHGGVAVGTRHGIRVGHGLAILLRGHHHAGEVFQVHLVDDAGVGGTTLKLSKAFWPQRRKP